MWAGTGCARRATRWTTTSRGCTSSWPSGRSWTRPWPQLTSRSSFAISRTEIAQEALLSTYCTSVYRLGRRVPRCWDGLQVVIGRSSSWKFLNDQLLFGVIKCEFGIPQRYCTRLPLCVLMGKPPCQYVRGYWQPSVKFVKWVSEGIGNPLTDSLEAINKVFSRHFKFGRSAKTLCSSVRDSSLEQLPEGTVLDHI